MRNRQNREKNFILPISNGLKWTLRFTDEGCPKNGQGKLGRSSFFEIVRHITARGEVPCTTVNHFAGSLMNDNFDVDK